MRDKKVTAQVIIYCLIAVIFCLACAILGPIIINSSYSQNSGDLTLWGAKEILSYYGTIVAAIIGIIGVILTVYVSNQNYRADARNRVLPFMAITVVNSKYPDAFSFGLSDDNHNFPLEDMNAITDLAGKTTYYVIDGVVDGKIKQRVAQELNPDEENKLNDTGILWKRGTKDGNMYLTYSGILSMPFLVENVGNGVAIKVRIGLSVRGNEPFYRTERIQKVGEKSAVHIFSTRKFEEIKGNSSLVICYEDILGNQYEQTFPIKVFEDEEEGKRFANIDTSGERRLVKARL